MASMTFSSFLRTTCAFSDNSKKGNDGIMELWKEGEKSSNGSLPSDMQDNTSIQETILHYPSIPVFLMRDKVEHDLSCA
jgi:hypothetical protein